MKFSLIKIELCPPPPPFLSQAAPASLEFHTVAQVPSAGIICVGLRGPLTYFRYITLRTQFIARADRAPLRISRISFKCMISDLELFDSFSLLQL